MKNREGLRAFDVMDITPYRTIFIQTWGMSSDAGSLLVGTHEPAPPVRVVLTRVVEESEHLVDAVVCSLDDVIVRHGNTSRSAIPRSALKPIQVVPLVHSGAASAFSLTDQQIALAAASHSGEVAHLEAVEAWLRQLGLDQSALECGASRPFAEAQADRLLMSGEPFQRLHNCCSGKHAGYLTIARHLGVDPAGYIQRDHPVQRLVDQTIETFTGVAIAEMQNGIDGCGVPTFSLPLEALARAMARLCNPADLDSSYVEASARVTTALSNNHFWSSGTGRPEVELGRAASEPLIIKTGAEGVFTAGLPARGLGIAIKTRDGATRAADLAIAAILEELEVISPGHAVANVTNAAGTVVGTMQAHLS